MIQNLKYLLMIVVMVFSYSFVQAQSGTEKRSLHNEVTQQRDSLGKVKPGKPEKKNRSLDIEFGGLVVDETISRPGHDFFELFFEKWQFPEGNKNSILTVSEKVMPRNGSMITILVNDAEVLVRQIPPRKDIIEEIVGECISATSDYLLRLNELQMQIYKGDMQGNGI